MKRRPGRSVELVDIEIPAGTRKDIEIPVARLPTQTFVTLPVAIVNGAREGPAMWISAAVHGDEVNGVEIVRRVLERLDPTTMAGTLYALPIVNVFGFIMKSRYLPDRRDLNRSFPGSSRGSLASRIAHLVMTQITSRCSHGIDLHTGSDNRTNLPQIRGNLTDAETARIAAAFGAPLMLQSRAPDGSFRRATTDRGACSLLYEAGQALQFEEQPIRIGTDGVLRVMGALGMTPRRGVDPRRPQPLAAGAPQRPAPTTGAGRRQRAQAADRRGDLGHLRHPPRDGPRRLPRACDRALAERVGQSRRSPAPPGRARHVLTPGASPG